MHLRPTRAADVPTLLTWEAESARWLGDTGPSWHARALADPAQDHLLAEESGDPVGFAVLAGLDQEEVELRRMVISPAHRGQGRGRELLRAAVARAARTVWLDVKADNHRARTLYESEGFTVTHHLATLIYMHRRP